MDKLEEIKGLVSAYHSDPNALMMDITFCRVEYLINEVERLRKDNKELRLALKGREWDGEKIPVAEHLTDSEYGLFLKVHADHTNAMGLEERKDYTLADIVKVQRNPAEKCLNVYYRNGDWWHYSVEPGGATWY